MGPLHTGTADVGCVAAAGRRPTWTGTVAAAVGTGGTAGSCRWGMRPRWNGGTAGAGTTVRTRTPRLRCQWLSRRTGGTACTGATACARMTQRRRRRNGGTVYACTTVWTPRRPATRRTARGLPTTCGKRL